MGIPSEIISLKKVAELHPLLNVHDLVGAMHVPEDAVVSSADVALALASAASQNGKQVGDLEDSVSPQAATPTQLLFCILAFSVLIYYLLLVFFCCCFFSQSHIFLFKSEGTIVLVLI